MVRDAGRSGTFLISWSQTQVDGHSGVPEAALAAGAYWRWSGAAVDIGPMVGAAEAAAPEDRRLVAAAIARDVVGQALGLGVSAEVADFDRSFTLTDGREGWIATLIDVPGNVHPLVMFAGRMPPTDVPLRVETAATRRDVQVPAEGAGVVCFTPGTWIETPGGARQIEHLAAGDKVMTRDGGAQELVWTGMRRLTVRDLHRMPDLAPVRIREGALDQLRADGDLIVSPDHRMLVRSRHSESGEVSEVLVPARDMVDGTRVVRELPVRPVTYVHLLLERHHILLANGFQTESFHPAAAALDAVPAADRLRLFDVMPMLRIEPQVYGPWARPALSRAEMALLAAA